MKRYDEGEKKRPLGFCCNLVVGHGVGYCIVQLLSFSSLLFLFSSSPSISSLLLQPLTNIHFECMMDKLEKGSGNTVLSDRDAQALLRDDEDLVLAVYEYWLGKRLRLVRSGG
jgi:hypothetical protein